MKGLLLAVMLTATPAAAGDVADLLMQPGILEDVSAQDLPEYKHERTLNAAPPTDEQSTEPVIALKNVTDGGVKLSRGSGDSEDKLQLSLSEGGEYHVVAEFSSGTSNPILLFFLENIVRAAASDSGGSPYYMRNRIREALVAAQPEGEQSTYTEIVLHPFAKDKNATRLGDFANLTITLQYDPTKPYRLLRLLANTGTDEESYSETMILVGEK